MSNQDTGFDEWVILELMGHRRLAGKVTEQVIAGGAFLRIDVPAEVTVTQFYRPESVYAITPTTEAIARKVAARSFVAPASRWELESREPRDEEERAVTERGEWIDDAGEDDLL